jgi:hypothetical protein
MILRLVKGVFIHDASCSVLINTRATGCITQQLGLSYLSTRLKNWKFRKEKLLCLVWLPIIKRHIYAWYALFSATEICIVKCGKAWYWIAWKHPGQCYGSIDWAFVKGFPAAFFFFAGKYVRSLMHMRTAVSRPTIFTMREQRAKEIHYFYKFDYII